MNKQQRIQYTASILLLAAIVIFILTAFSMMRKPGVTETYLMETQSQSYGWSYEVLQDGRVETAEPAFLSEYAMYFPDMEPEAIRITRVITEEEGLEKLELRPYNAGVEVFLDGRLMYSDFRMDERDEAGFLILNEKALQRIIPEFRTVSFSLPGDCYGKELSVVTYFSEGSAENVPVFPFFTSAAVEWALASTVTVLPMAMATLCAVFAVALSIIYVLDISNGNADYRIFFLVLFFLLLFLDKVYISMPGSYSILKDRLDLSFLSDLYTIPLYFYLALHLQGKKARYILCGCIALWSAYALVWGYRLWRMNLLAGYAQDKVQVFLLLLLVLAALGIEYLRRERKKEHAFRWYYAAFLCMAVFAALLLYAEDWEGDLLLCMQQMVSSLAYGHCLAAVRFLSTVISIMAVFILVMEFIQRTYQNQIQIRVLEERNRYAMESYERMLAAEEATHAIRHEMRHHMTVLRELFRSRDAERTARYMDALETELDQLPAMKYSKNMLVNVLAGTYLEQAKKLGIHVQHQLMVPESLNMADEDLCVFLSNMLENALNACRRIAPDQERFIRIVMHMEGNFLYIGCVNSMPDERTEEILVQETKESRRHGYGLAAMRKIAEKYGSVLKVDRSPSVFSVKSNLCLNGK